MNDREPRLGAGVIAGAVGGLISGFVKLGWEQPFPPRPAGRVPEPAVLVTMFTHAPAPDWSVMAIHFAFSILAGMLYGALVEGVPIVALGLGAAYGLAVWIGAHELVMPLIGLTPAVWQLTPQEQLSESVGHVVWGMTIELVRGDVRTRLGHGRVSDLPRARSGVARATR